MPKNLSGIWAKCKPKEIRDLGSKNNDGDTAGKTYGHRKGDEFNDIPHFGDAHQDKHNSGHDGRQSQAVIAVFLDNAEDNDDKSTGRPADLHPAAGKSGY